MLANKTRPVYFQQLFSRAIHIFYSEVIIKDEHSITDRFHNISQLFGSFLDLLISQFLSRNIRNTHAHSIYLTHGPNYRLHHNIEPGSTIALLKFDFIFYANPLQRFFHISSCRLLSLVGQKWDWI